MSLLQKNEVAATMFDRWRIVPRALVSMYGYLMYEVTMWFMALPDPNMAQAGFVSTIIGAAAAIFNFYVTSGGQKTAVTQSSRSLDKKTEKKAKSSEVNPE